MLHFRSYSLCVISFLILQRYPFCAVSNQSLEATVHLSQKENNKTLETLQGIQMLKHFAIAPSHYLVFFSIHSGGQFCFSDWGHHPGLTGFPPCFSLYFPHADFSIVRDNLVLIFPYLSFINAINNLALKFLFIKF